LQFDRSAAAQAGVARVHAAAGAVPADFHPGGHLEGAAGVLLRAHLQRAVAVLRGGGLRGRLSHGHGLVESVQAGVGAQRRAAVDAVGRHHPQPHPHSPALRHARHLLRRLRHSLARPASHFFRHSGIF
jgi:hypothetical protein